METYNENLSISAPLLSLALISKNTCRIIHASSRQILRSCQYPSASCFTEYICLLFTRVWGVLSKANRTRQKASLPVPQQSSASWTVQYPISCTAHISTPSGIVARRLRGEYQSPLQRIAPDVNICMLKSTYGHSKIVTLSETRSLCAWIYSLKHQMAVHTTTITLVNLPEIAPLHYFRNTRRSVYTRAFSRLVRHNICSEAASRHVDSSIFRKELRAVKFSMPILLCT